MELYKKVGENRYKQLLLNEMLKKKQFLVPVHLSMGNEALAVALADVVGPDDSVLLTHRNIAYNLAFNPNFLSILDEFKQKKEGVCGGLFGSMNLYTPNGPIKYTSSILGNNLPVGVGFAFSDKVKGKNAITFILTGDGAIEEGSFYESLVFSKTHGLQVVFVVENNNQSMSSTIRDRRCPINLDMFCNSVGVPYRKFQSNDVIEYRSHLIQICSEVKHECPVCIEVKVQAYCQHAGPTPGWPEDQKVIDIKNGLCIDDSEADSLFVIKNKLGLEEFASFEQAIITNIGF